MYKGLFLFVVIQKKLVFGVRIAFFTLVILFSFMFDIICSTTNFRDLPVFSPVVKVVVHSLVCVCVFN